MNSVIFLLSSVEILSVGILLLVLIVSQKVRTIWSYIKKKIKTWLQEKTLFTQLDIVIFEMEWIAMKMQNCSHILKNSQYTFKEKWMYKKKMHNF